MLSSGFVDYITDPWNWIDIIGVASYVAMFVEVLNGAQRMHIIRVIIICQMIAKVNFYLRVYDKFGLLVNLVRTCFADIVPFSAYLGTWILAFIMLYVQIGIVAPAQKGFDPLWLMVFYVWGNSIGNINYPDDSTFTKGMSLD